MTEPAVIGKFYMVPCIFVSGKARYPAWPALIPVLGPKHEDREHLNFPHEHYHIDWRFVPASMFDDCIGPSSRSVHGRVITNTHGGHVIQGAPVLKRRMCKREMPDFPARPAQGIFSPTRSWVGLEQAHACARLKPGNICPHRGIDLTPFVKADGTVICPGHGLRWDTKSGELLAYHSPAADVSA